MSFGLQFADKADVLAMLGQQASSELRCDRARSIRFEIARHAFVVGDNLEALRVLRPAYAGRVQMIYIDPPYNTGSDLVYRDRFAETRAAFVRRTGQVDALGERLVPNPQAAGRYHSAWLAMMYPRLWEARQLLRDDGVLFVSIDDHEVHHLRLLLDEIFGEECFIAAVVVVTNRGGRDYLRIATGHEYLLVYGATPQAPIRELARVSDEPTREDARGPYELRELRNRNPRFGPHNRPNLFYPVYANPDLVDAHGCCAVSVEPRPGYAVAIEPRNRMGEGSVWRWSRRKLEGAIVHDDPGGSEVVARRRRDGGFNVYEKNRKRTAKARGLWNEPAMRTEQGTADLRAVLGAAVFDHPKPVALVRRCLQLATERDAIVLDFFAGSGTTAQAVFEQNAADGGARRFVGVQLAEAVAKGSEAAAAGFATIADVAHARIAGTLPADADVRWLELVPRPVVEGLALRPDADPLSVAVAAGIGLDAAVSEHEGWTVVREGDRTLAVGSGAAGVETFAALDVPAGSSVWLPDAAWDDGTRLQASLRHRLLPGSMR